MSKYCIHLWMSRFALDRKYFSSGLLTVIALPERGRWCTPVPGERSDPPPGSHEVDLGVARTAGQRRVARAAVEEGLARPGTRRPFGSGRRGVVAQPGP